MENKTLLQLCRKPQHCLAFGLGSGLLNPAPGTWGTLMGLLCYLGLQFLPISIYSLVTLLATLLGIWLCGATSRALGVHDHKAIVWDEMCGYWITMLGAPVTVGHIVAGFVLFRFFDIVKPFPISFLDKKLTGGLGIMLDDVAAGLLAAACLFLFF